MPKTKQAPPKIEHHTEWIIKSDVIQTDEGVDVELWEFRHQPNDNLLKKWAAHFRNHYCPDDQIDALRASRSRRDYLNEIKFPDGPGGNPLGPAIRAGDFAEILLADFLQYVEGSWVPRVRWSNRASKNDSTKGSDVIGFYLADINAPNKEDVLTVFEVKAGFSKSSANRLQDAVIGSISDKLRLEESLNYIRQHLHDRKDLDGVKKVDRFQNPVDNTYTKNFGAAALLTQSWLDKSVIAKTCVEQIVVPKGKKMEILSHPYSNTLRLIVISGDDLMKLTHALYLRAADEA